MFRLRANQRRITPLLWIVGSAFLFLIIGCEADRRPVVVEGTLPLPTPSLTPELVLTGLPTVLPPLTEEPIATTGPTPALTSTPTLPALGDNKTHPYLLFNNQDIIQYKRDITQPGNFRQSLFVALRDYHLNQESDPSMSSSAFFTLLTGDSAALTKAKSLFMEKIAENCWDPTDEDHCRRSGGAGGVLAVVSLSYDWLYPQLLNAEREQAKDRIAGEVCRYYEAFTYGTNNAAEGWNNWWIADYTQNHFHSVTSGMALGALAIMHDNPPLCTAINKDGQQKVVTNLEILDFTVHKMERNYLIFDRISDGSYPEGDSYVAAYSNTYLSALWAVQRLLSPRLELVREKRLSMFPLFYLYNAPPGQLWNQLTNHGDYFTSSRENYFFPKDLHFSAMVYQDRLAAWVAEQYYYDKAGSVKIPPDNSTAAANMVLDFIFTDPALKPQPPAEANLDLSYHAADWEGVLMRSNWSDTAVAAAIKVGPPGGHTAYNIARSNYQGDQWVGQGQEPTEFELNTDHMHADANGIYLYANKTFLLPEMMGYEDDTPWGRYTSSHNTILVSDAQGQMRGQIQGDAIGGVGLGYGRWYPGTEEFWHIESPENEVGIIEHAATPGYDYSLGQATSAYWAELELKRFQRHVLFGRDPGYMLVVDDLDAATVKTYDWLGHSTGPVTQEGQWLKVNADNDQRLGLAVLSPANFTFDPATNEWAGIKLTDVYRFRYVSANRTMYEWKIRQNCQTCRFITFLFPTDETRWRQKPTVTRLADTDQLAAIQVNFESDNRTDTLAISLTPGQTLEAGTLTFDGRVAVVERTDLAIQRALLIQGTHLQEGDIELIGNLSNVSFLEVWYKDKENITLRSPDPANATLFAPGVNHVSWQCVDENNVVITKPLPFTRHGDYITLNTEGIK